MSLPFYSKKMHRSDFLSKSASPKGLLPTIFKILMSAPLLIRVKAEIVDPLLAA